MSWDLQTAQKHLDVWLEAELAIATNQAIRIGGRHLQRADLNYVHEQVKFWRTEVAKLQAGRRGIQVRRVIPWDK